MLVFVVGVFFARCTGDFFVCGLAHPCASFSRRNSRTELKFINRIPAREPFFRTATDLILPASINSYAFDLRIPKRRCKSSNRPYSICSICSVSMLACSSTHLRESVGFLKNNCPKLNPFAVCERARTCPNTGSVVMPECYAIAIICRFYESSDPNGIRTRVTAVKGRCPRPLDDRVTRAGQYRN
jgi:hypothetical protein